MASLPVTIVSGFLGTGKTTLLNHLLKYTPNVRIGVIVNDFGAVNVDALFVTAQADSMLTFGNGCLCCVSDENTFEEMLDTLSNPSSELDAIVVEASGLAEPQNLVTRVLDSRNPRIRYGGLIEVVDAEAYRQTVGQHPEIQKHLKLADILVINKTDLMSETEMAELTAELHRLNPKATLVPTEYSQLNPELLFDAQAERYGQLSFADLIDREHHHHDHLHDHYQSVSWQSTQPVHPRRLMEFIDSRPAGLYRMKGRLFFDVPKHRDCYELQTVGKHLRFTRKRWEKDQVPHTDLVMIGTDLEEADLTQRIAECALSPGEALDEHAMLGVIRYTLTVGS